MLSQSEADGLIQVHKVFVDRNPLILNRPTNLERQLLSVAQSSDRFYLNITQTAIEFGKYTANTRFFSIPLVRVCIGEDIVHTNPNDEDIAGPHVHVYQAGHFDTYARPLSEFRWDNSTMIKLMKAFLKFCNIEDIKLIDQKIMGAP